jgi:hypothetical protein
MNPEAGQQPRRRREAMAVLPIVFGLPELEAADVAGTTD